MGLTHHQVAYLRHFIVRVNTVLPVTTAAVPASKVEAILRSPTNMATAKIAAVDFIDLYIKYSRLTSTK